MKYTFSPAADFDRLEEAAAELYVPSAVSAQVQRYRRLLSGFAETWPLRPGGGVFRAGPDGDRRQPHGPPAWPRAGGEH